MAQIQVVDAGGNTMDLVEHEDGYRLCNFGLQPEVAIDIYRNVPNIPIRDDDVFLFTPAKSGTHWVWEISNMLLKGRADTVPTSKVRYMMEHIPIRRLEELPSPRILNSHLRIRDLPVEVFNKKCKILHVLRNPKDVLASWYNHVTGIQDYSYDGKWDDFLQLFFENKLEYGNWFDYVQEWEKLIKDRPDLPIHVVHYEDLTLNNEAEIRRIAEFLGVLADDNLVRAISEKCRFQNMKVDKAPPDDVMKNVFKGDFFMYRKGKIGDYRNWFTVAQNEQFNALYAEKMKSSKLKFRYSENSEPV